MGTAPDTAKGGLSSSLTFTSDLANKTSRAASSCPSPELVLHTQGVQVLSCYGWLEHLTAHQI